MSSKKDSGFLKKSVAIRRMGGKGAPVETLPGVMGHQVQSAYARSLGGLISDTKHLGGPLPKVFSDKIAFETDKCVIQHSAPASHIPGQHYGQRLYPGPFCYHQGERLGIKA